MSKHGTALGADLYELWDAGTNMLPGVADDFETAWENVPFGVSDLCTRSGGLGLGTYGGGSGIDYALDQLNDCISTTQKNLRATGHALVWIANEYAKTDDTAKAEFNRKKRDMDGS